MNRFRRHLLLTGIFFSSIVFAQIFSNHPLSSSSTALQFSIFFSNLDFTNQFQADSLPIFTISFLGESNLFRILMELVEWVVRHELKLQYILMAVIAAILIVIISIPIIICVWLWRLTQTQIAKLSLSIYLKQPNTCRLYTGEISLPKKAYEGNSESVSVKITSFSPKVYMMPESFNQALEKNSFVFVKESNILSEEIEQQLEITLLTGSGITVKGDEKQIHDLKSSIEYKWICSFTASSKQEVSLKFNLLPTIKLEESDKSDIKFQKESSEIGYINRRVTIANFLSLTKNQIEQLKTFLLCISPITTAIGIKSFPGLWTALYSSIAKFLGV